MKTLTRNTSLTLLKTRCSVQDGELNLSFVPTNKVCRPTLPADAERLDELLDLLDGLPLAIAEAGAYMKRNRVNISEYLDLQKERWARLHSAKYMGSMVAEYPDRTIGTTWTSSFENIRARSEQTANLLLLWSHLHHKDLWFDLFNKMMLNDDVMSADLHEYVGKTLSSATVFGEAMQLLQDYSMIEGVNSEGGYQIHTVVHQWAYNQQSAETKAKLRCLSLCLVASRLPKWWKESGPIKKRLLPHADAFKWNATEWTLMKKYCSKRMGQLDVVLTKGDEDICRALRQIGELHTYNSNYDEAEQWLTQALRECEPVLGPHHALTLDTCAFLGFVQFQNNKLSEAAQTYERDLKGSGVVPESDGERQVKSAYALGHIYEEPGKFDEAELMLERALKGWEEALGPKHEETLDLVSNLGRTYNKQGNHDKAEQMLKRAMQGRQEVLGPNHEETLCAVGQLAEVYSEQYKWDQAELLYKRAEQGDQETLGEAQLLTHREALQLWWNMGDFYDNRSQFSWARQYYERALSGYDKLNGPASFYCRTLRRRLSKLAALEVDNKKASSSSRRRRKPD